MASKKRLFLWLAGLVLLVSGVLVLYDLGAAPFQDYDEATYAEVTAETLAHGNYFGLTFLNNPYFRKPPLLFWLAGISREVIPNDEFAMRLPGALAAVAAVAIVMLLCFEITGSAATAVLAGAILTTTSAFIEPARSLRFDILVACFVIATVYAGVRAQRDARWYVAAGAFLGLAVLSKGIIAAFALVALIPYAVQTRFSFFRSRWFWYGVLAFVVVAIPWHAYETYVYGVQFWHSYFGNEVLTRAQINLFPGTNAPTNAGYVFYLLTFGAPWTEVFLAICAGFMFLYTRINTRTHVALLSSVLGVLSVLAIMFVAHTKAVNYLDSLYPFMAVAISLFVYELYERSNEHIRLDIVYALVVCVFFGLVLTVFNAFHVNSYYVYQDEFAREEKSVGLIIKNTPNAGPVYEYQDEFLGSIQFYSHLPFTQNPFVLLLSDSSTPEPNSFVVTSASEKTLAHQFPQFTFKSLYEGADVSLFKID